MNALMRRSANAAVRVGPSTQIKQVDDPCRAIEIVAPSGQLYATNRKRPIATARATQKVPAVRRPVKKSAGKRSDGIERLGSLLNSRQENSKCAAQLREGLVLMSRPVETGDKWPSTEAAKRRRGRSKVKFPATPLLRFEIGV
ncbi:MAG: hypothetical protein ACXWKP_26670 [Bradyrhizobium sp.]